LAVHLSVRKRARQNKKAKLINNVWKSKSKTLRKKIEKAISNNEMNLLPSLYKEYVSTLDRAASRNVFKKNNVARKKAGIANKINAVQSINKS